jgi:hypothetical protein
VLLLLVAQRCGQKLKSGVDRRREKMIGVAQETLQCDKE